MPIGRKAQQVLQPLTRRAGTKVKQLEGHREGRGDGHRSPRAQDTVTHSRLGFPHPMEGMCSQEEPLPGVQAKVKAWECSRQSSKQRAPRRAIYGYKNE